MQSVIHRLGPPVPANGNCRNESENRPTFGDMSQDQVSVDKESSSSSAAPDLDSAKTARCQNAAKVRRKGSSLRSNKNTSFISRRTQEEITEQSPSSPPNLPPKLKTAPTVNPLLASVSAPSNDKTVHGAVTAEEAKQARQAVTRVLLGPPVGDLTCRGSNSDEYSSRCCLWSSGCLFRRTEAPDSSSNCNSNRSAGGHVAEYAASTPADVTAAQPSKAALVETEVHDNRDIGQTEPGVGKSCIDQGENGIGVTESSLDDKTNSVKNQAFSGSNASATAEGACEGLVGASDEDFAHTTVSPAALIPGVVQANENSSPLVESAAASALKHSSALHATEITISTVTEVNAAQSQETTEPAPSSAPHTAANAAPNTKATMNQLGGYVDVDSKIAVQQGGVLGIADFGQLLINLRQVSASICIKR